MLVLQIPVDTFAEEWISGNDISVETDFTENTGWKMWRLAMTHRSMVDMAGGSIKTKLVNSLFKNSWGKRRDNLHFNKTYKQKFSDRSK